MSGTSCAASMTTRLPPTPRTSKRSKGQKRWHTDGSDRFGWVLQVRGIRGSRDPPPTKYSKNPSNHLPDRFQEFAVGGAPPCIMSLRRDLPRRAAGQITLADALEPNDQPHRHGVA
jgi:hypothetical protein